MTVISEVTTLVTVIKKIIDSPLKRRQLIVNIMKEKTPVNCKEREKDPDLVASEVAV